MTTSNKIDELKYMLVFDYCFSVDRTGRGGGLACLWKKNLNCTITNYSQNHIDMEIDDSLRGKWRLTGFYGMPGRRRQSWNLLRQISNLSQLPWCIIGDFNDTLSANEKKGRSDRQPWLIQGFRQAVLDVGLVDIHMDGYVFTWFKSLGTDRAVEEKLDRAMTNDSWFDKFQNAKLECLTTTSSDHYPLWLDCAPQPSSSCGQRRFRFENAWLVEPEFGCFVSQRWQGYGEHPLVHKLKQCIVDLSKWSLNVNQNTRQEIRKTQRKLKAVRSHVDASNVSYFNMLRHRLDKLLIKDDIFWKQHAKTFWYRDGDLNRSFSMRQPPQGKS